MFHSTDVWVIVIVNVYIRYWIDVNDDRVDVLFFKSSDAEWEDAAAECDGKQ